MRSRSCRLASTAFKELVNGRAADYEDRYAPFAYDGTPDFKVAVVPHHQRDALGVQARLDAVRRLAAGAEGLGQPSGFRYGQDFGDIFSTPSSNAFLVKLAYWLNP